jgi:hypothetical protein
MVYWTQKHEKRKSKSDKMVYRTRKHDKSKSKSDIFTSAQTASLVLHKNTVQQ